MFLLQSLYREKIYNSNLREAALIGFSLLHPKTNSRGHYSFYCIKLTESNIKYTQHQLNLINRRIFVNPY